jgi:hypothetical protein
MNLQPMNLNVGDHPSIQEDRASMPHVCAFYLLFILTCFYFLGGSLQKLSQREQELAALSHKTIKFVQAEREEKSKRDDSVARLTQQLQDTQYVQKIGTAPYCVVVSDVFVCEIVLQSQTRGCSKFRGPRDGSQERLGRSPC